MGVAVGSAWLLSAELAGAAVSVADPAGAKVGVGLVVQADTANNRQAHNAMLKLVFTYTILERRNQLIGRFIGLERSVLNSRQQVMQPLACSTQRGGHAS
jgi:hypothetical protein